MKIGDFLLFSKGKDGGPESNVTGYWLIQIKSLFSVVLLRFDEGSREAYHSHAFDAISWVLKGKLEEHDQKQTYGRVYVNNIRTHTPTWRPIFTYKDTFHKVYGRAKHTWVLSLRGPWNDTWYEWSEKTGPVTLTHNRIEVKNECD